LPREVFERRKMNGRRVARNVSARGGNECAARRAVPCVGLDLSHRGGGQLAINELVDSGPDGAANDAAISWLERMHHRWQSPGDPPLSNHRSQCAESDGAQNARAPPTSPARRPVRKFTCRTGNPGIV